MSHISIKKGYKDILAKNGPIKNINGPIENLSGPIENLDGPIEIGGIIDKQVDKEVDKKYIKRSKEEQSSVNTNKPTKNLESYKI